MSTIEWHSLGLRRQIGETPFHIILIEPSNDLALYPWRYIVAQKWAHGIGHHKIAREVFRGFAETAAGAINFLEAQNL